MNDLRRWQQECVDRALEHYSYSRHFLAVATPGAGKSRMAAELSKQLFEHDKIDFVLCFSPSRVVADGLRETFSSHLGKRFDGALGALGCSYTYHSIKYLQGHLLQLLSEFRVLVVFDEIHHCSGDNPENANSWGEQLLLTIQEGAAFTLALSGTPWRSDRAPVCFARYSEPGGQVVCDYVYSLKDAIGDRVCRIPKVTLLDNDKIELKEKVKGSEFFTGFKELLKSTNIKYQTVLSQQTAISHLLKIACKKLEKLRIQNADAAGLVVASSVKHANQVARILLEDFNKKAVIVHHYQNDSISIINRFRISDEEWIVSVGMISEGTDIPRLQVCCHLSRIRTELYFRQVLGRVLRTTDQPNKIAWLFSFAEPAISKFAENLDKEIPNLDVLNKIYISSEDMESDFTGCQKNSKPYTFTEDGEQLDDSFSLESKSILLGGESFELVVSEDFRQRVVDLFSAGATYKNESC